MKFRFLLSTLILILFIHPVYAQYAATQTSPFEAVRADGNKTMVLVEGLWYETLAIGGTPSTLPIEYCRYKYKDNWLYYFSEQLVEVMQQMKKPLNKNVELQLLNGNERITKKVVMTNAHFKAVQNYNKIRNVYKPQKNASADKSVDEDLHLTKEKPYGFKSIKIVYLYTGSRANDGVEVLFIEDYGKTVIVISEKTEANGAKNIQTTIWKDNKTTMIDHKNKTWKTMPTRAQSTEPPTVGYKTEAQNKQDGYVRSDNMSISRKSCKVYKNAETHFTHWNWQGVDLKLIYEPAGQKGYSKIATAVYENITIPASITNIPGDYKKL